MEELKRCPFCRGKAELLHFMHSSRPPMLWYVSCNECNAETNAYETEEQAIAAWNQRAELTCHGDMDTDYYSGKLDRFSCSNCGIEWAVDDGMAPTTKVSYCPNCGAKVVE